MSKADQLLKRVEFYEKMASSSQKPETNELLNKASLFERLALYSDRKSFLEAIAQETLLEGQTPQDPHLRPYADPDWEAARSQEFGNARFIPKPEPVKQLTPQEEAAQAMKGPADITFKPDPKKDQIRALPPINRNDQQALLRFVTEEGMAFVDPSKMNDGLLGPETRKALEGVKNYFAQKFPQNPRMTDQQAITAAKAPRRQ